MSRTVYVNGDYLPEEDAKVSIFDRGFLFADGVYEVTAVLGGKLLDFDGHSARLKRSLGELDMGEPITRDELLAVHRELVARNDITDGMIYLQITRGAADRDFAFPAEGTKQTVVLFTQSKPGLADNPAARTGIRVISIPDLRWGRRDIKTVQLLYPSMGKMMAKRAGADDAWMVEDGHVTEGTSNNAYIVRGRTIVTRQLGTEILHGITRAAVLRFAREAQFEIEERPFTIAEAQAADEAFITSASAFVMPVVAIDDRAARPGHPRPGRDPPARDLPRRKPPYRDLAEQPAQRVRTAQDRADVAAFLAVLAALVRDAVDRRKLRGLELRHVDFAKAKLAQVEPRQLLQLGQRHRRGSEREERRQRDRQRSHRRSGLVASFQRRIDRITCRVRKSLP